MSEPVREESAGGRISLDQLIALNDEIAALARAGMPLERGLLDLGGDLPGRLGQIATVLGERMSRGESLPEALAAEGDKFPRLYRGVVEAGLRAGRLPAALEGVASFVRGYAETRRAIGLAIGYPLIVLLVAYSLFVMLVTFVMPRFLAAFESARLPVSRLLPLVVRLGGSARYWGPVIPVLVLLWVGLWWLRSGQAGGLSASRSGSSLRWFPWMRSLVAQAEAANFADLFALLIEHQVPYPRAIVLASEASGDPVLIRAGRELALNVERGSPPRDVQVGPNAFPPLLRWLLSDGRDQGGEVAALRQMAKIYRTRALLQAEKVRIFLPTMLLFAIGATATLLYALTLFIPLATLLKSMAVP